MPLTHTSADIDELVERHTPQELAEIIMDLKFLNESIKTEKNELAADVDNLNAEIDEMKQSALVAQDIRRAPIHRAYIASYIQTDPQTVFVTLEVSATPGETLYWRKGGEVVMAEANIADFETLASAI